MASLAIRLASYLSIVCNLELPDPVNAMWDGLDGFGGELALTKACVRKGLAWAWFDKVWDPLQDFLTDVGFVMVFRIIGNTKRNGMVHWGTCCSSWVFLNRSTSGRSATNALGSDTGYVRDANVMVARMVWLVLWGIIRGVHWILEQPISSLMGCHPKMVLLRTLADLHVIEMDHVTGWMGKHGAMTPKATKWWGSRDLCPLGGTLTKEDRDILPGASTVVKGYNADGSVKVSGGPQLKETQTYTHGYGEVVASLHLLARETHGPPAFNAARLAKHVFESVSWEDCEFAGLDAFLAREGFC